MSLKLIELSFLSVEDRYKTEKLRKTQVKTKHVLSAGKLHLRLTQITPSSSSAATTSASLDV